MAPAIKEKAWSTLQIENLVDEYMARKGVILGALRPGFTKEHKKRAWTEIVEALGHACPDEPFHDVEETKKKFANIKAIATANIAECNRSLSETGGGQQVILKPLHLKMPNELFGLVFGKTNAALAGNSIPGGVQSETGINDPTQELIGRSNNEKNALSIHDSEPLLSSCSNNEHVEIASDIYRDDPELEMAMTICNRKSFEEFQEDEDDYESNSPTCSLREAVNRCKRQRCEKSDMSSSKRLLRDRLDVLNSTILARKLMDDPIRDDEIPKDLYDIMYGKTKDSI